MVNSACIFCGVDSLATCVRCGQRYCAQHYVLKVWYVDERGWAEETPNGSQWMHANGDLVLRDDSYTKGYAAGGPGCVECRRSAAVAAQTSARNLLAAFLAHGDAVALAGVADASDILTSDDYMAIGGKLNEVLPRTATLVRLRTEPPARLKRGRDVHPAVIKVLDREEVPWVPVGTESGRWLSGGIAASHGRGLLVSPAMNGRRDDMLVVLTRGQEPAVSFRPAFRDGTESWTVTSGTEVGALHLRKYHLGGREALLTVARAMRARQR